jgi:dynein intermediate chain 2
VNTERIILKNSSIRHVEGGWAKEIDYLEQSDTNRFRKKAEKDEDYKASVKNLAPIVTRVLKQNQTVDIYEVQYMNNTPFLMSFNFVLELLQWDKS